MVTYSKEYGEKKKYKMKQKEKQCFSVHFLPRSVWIITLGSKAIVLQVKGL